MGDVLIHFESNAAINAVLRDHMNLIDSARGVWKDASASISCHDDALRYATNSPLADHSQSYRDLIACGH